MCWKHKGLDLYNFSVYKYELVSDFDKYILMGLCIELYLKFLRTMHPKKWKLKYTMLLIFPYYDNTKIPLLTFSACLLIHFNHFL